MRTYSKSVGIPKAVHINVNRLRSRLGADFSRDHSKIIFDCGHSSESNRPPRVRHFPGFIFLILLQIRAAGDASCPAPFLHQKDESGKVSYQRGGFQLWSCKNRTKIGAQSRTQSYTYYILYNTAVYIIIVTARAGYSYALHE